MWVNGGGGNDTLFAGTGNLDFLAANVTFNGGTGADAARIDDSSANAPRTFTVTGADITMTSGAGTPFAGVAFPEAQTVELFGPASSFLDNTYRVDSTIAGRA